MPRNNNQEQDLKLHPGMLLEVLTQDNQVVFVARVEEMDRRSVKLVSASGDVLPDVFYNTKISLRGFLSDTQTVLFHGVVRGNSQRFWLIEELEGEVRKGRSFFRQQVSVKARVSCVNRIYAPERTETSSRKIAPCEILDISGGGARITSQEKYQVGDWLSIMEANFAPVKKTFSFTGRVLRAEFKRNMYIYGCQFEGLTQKEQDQLIEMIFLLQREERQHKLGRNGR